MRNNNALLALLSSLILLQTPSTGLADTCTVSTTSINFGTYDVFSATAASTTGTITVTCSPVNAPYTIALNSGLHGTVNQRYLAQTGGSDILQYGIYTDPTHSTNWGDGTGNSVTVTNTSPQPNQIYAMAPGGQDMTAGSYSDMLTVTVSF